jgi:SRSO17 transposase
MAARIAPDRYDRLHHFISDGIWDAAPLEAELAKQADRLIGGSDAFLVIDDTSLPKKGEHSVGVAPQYASMLGKRANCQTLVSLTLARHEVPIAVGLRLFLPESWTSDLPRMARAGVPEPFRRPLTKPEIALEEIDRLTAQGVRFDAVLADAGYGHSSLPSGAERAWACLGRRHSQTSKGLSRRRFLDLSCGGPRPAAQEPDPRSALGRSRDNTDQGQVEESQLAPRRQRSFERPFRRAAHPRRGRAASAHFR